jgi:copper(I)-binding protein
VIRSARPRRGNVSLRRLLVVSAAVLVPILAGCEAGNDAPTLDFHPSTDSATANAGDIAIRNVFVLGAPLGSSLQPGATASLFFSLVTTGTADRLLSISAPGSAKSVHLPGGGIAVIPGKPVYISGPQTLAYLVDLTRKITSGSDLPLVLHFKIEGRVDVQVPVLPRAAQYTTFPAAPSPSPSATPAAKHHTAKATVSTSASVSPTPSSSPA